MRAIRRVRPTPALVVACLALLVALAETSWATVSALVPRNSVGTAQLRTGAVTSAKIETPSVALADLAPGARLPGPPGPAGPAGPGGSVSRLWAVTNASGSLARSAGTSSAGRTALGTYEVVFTQNVTNCVFVASVGGTDVAVATGYATAQRGRQRECGVRPNAQHGRRGCRPSVPPDRRLLTSQGPASPPRRPP